jgi:hypothetical protein
MADLDFRAPVKAITARDIARNLDALGYPEGWTAEDDLMLVSGAFKFSNMLSVSITLRRTYAETVLRWSELRKATVGHGEWSLTAQRALLDAVSARVSA